MVYFFNHMEKEETESIMIKRGTKMLTSQKGLLSFLLFFSLRFQLTLSNITRIDIENVYGIANAADVPARVLIKHTN